MKNNRIKSQKGVTMISLIIYVASFLTVTIVIGYITTFFYNNVNVMNDTAGMSADYNTIMACIKKETKKSDATKDLVSSCFVRSGDILYYKPRGTSYVIAIARNVGAWTVGTNTSQFDVTMQLNGITYSNKFALKY